MKITVSLSAAKPKKSKAQLNKDLQVLMSLGLTVGSTPPQKISANSYILVPKSPREIKSELEGQGWTYEKVQSSKSHAFFFVHKIYPGVTLKVFSAENALYDDLSHWNVDGEPFVSEIQVL